MRKTPFAVVGLAALALGAAGCGSSSNNNDSSSASTPAVPPATQTQAATTSKPAAGASTINVGATEFKFTPGTLNAKAGEVTFDLKNNGAAPHALVVEGNGIGEKKTDIIMGGQTATLKVNLKPGKYKFYCPVDGHRQQGMEGTLTVT